MFNRPMTAASVLASVHVDRLVFGGRAVGHCRGARVRRFMAGVTMTAIHAPPRRTTHLDFLCEKIIAERDDGWEAKSVHFRSGGEHV